MSFFRSDPVDRFKIIVPHENAWNILNMLGFFWSLSFRIAKFSSYCEKLKT